MRIYLRAVVVIGVINPPLTTYLPWSMLNVFYVLLTTSNNNNNNNNTNVIFLARTFMII